MGTEAGQYRAERVFIWSIKQVCDPSRVYEIYLMKDLPGFNRRWWLTGFTNYRFAVPSLAGGAGRAIYNDVDQIYLADPALLFDADMAHYGFLSISRQDTSVMLLDCARMAQVWTREAAQGWRRQALEATARAIPGLWGSIDAEWNARDEEYAPNRSRLVHFTVLQTQPWRPFPEHYVYQPNPTGDLWPDLERSADQAGFQPFTAAHPSARYQECLAQFGTCAKTVAGGNSLGHGFRMPVETHDLQKVLHKAQSHTVLSYGLPLGEGTVRGIGGVANGRTPTVKHCGLAQPPWATLEGERFDAVICIRALEYLPDEDLPWVVEALFSQANRLVYAVIEDSSKIKTLPDGRMYEIGCRKPDRWNACFEAAGKRYPHVHWKIVLRTRGAWGQDVRESRAGGRLLDDPPNVWVLAHHKPGHTSQSVGLAEALGWPYQVKELPFTTMGYLIRRVMEMGGLRRSGGSDPVCQTLGSPWPDVVIATGWLPTRIVRWLRRQTNRTISLVLQGRKNGRSSAMGDVLVTCGHFGLPLHSRQIETILPPHPTTPERLACEAERRPDLFGSAPRPHVVLLVGGGSRQYQLDERTAWRMGKEVQSFAAAAGGSVFALTSRRTGPQATKALQDGLGPTGHLYEWRPQDSDNPYFSYLALADVLVVTGESESMLAESSATDKPLYIYPLPHKKSLWWQFSRWVADRARDRPINKRGTVRPQQGLEYFCGRLIERGVILPPRDLTSLHQRLIDRGVAHLFGEPLELGTRPPFRETEEIAAQVKALLGFSSLLTKSEECIEARSR